MKDMTYADAIERVMRDNGGYAPLLLLYQDVWKHKDRAKVRGLTPCDTIRRYAQTDPRFVSIGLGVYALKSVQEAGALPVEPPARTSEERRERQHARMQGMLIEIGNHTPGVVNTYTPDRKAVFQNKKLGSISTLEKPPAFTYPKVIKIVGRVDVLWFNQRVEGGYPIRAYEVEHAGNFYPALARLSMLLDFRTELYCIAEARRRDAYERVAAMPAYRAVAKVCQFRTYEDVEADYETRLRQLRL